MAASTNQSTETDAKFKALADRLGVPVESIRLAPPRANPPLKSGENEYDALIREDIEREAATGMAVMPMPKDSPSPPMEPAAIVVLTVLVLLALTAAVVFVRMYRQRRLLASKISRAAAALAILWVAGIQLLHSVDLLDLNDDQALVLTAFVPLATLIGAISWRWVARGR